MAFSIRSARVEEKARAYAAQEGTTLTGALEKALDTVLAQRERAPDPGDPPGRNAHGETFAEWYGKIQEIQRRYAALPSSGLTEDEIMGWDEDGLPT